MRKPPFLVAIFFVCIGCTNEISNNKLIGELEKQIDSLTTVSKRSVLLEVPDMDAYEAASNFQKQLADSLLELDSWNATALSVKAFEALSDRDIPKIKTYFLRLHELGELKGSDNIYLGWSYEMENEEDSAFYFYELALNVMDSTFEYPAGKPQLLTVLRSKEEGMKELKRIEADLPEIFHLQTLNDISLYDNEGLTTMFPVWFEERINHKFYITIPKELKEQRIINSMDKVEVFFARLGINVDCTGTDNKNNGYYISTTDRYSDQLLELDTLSIKKL